MLRLLLVEDSKLDAQLVTAQLVDGGLDAEVTRVETQAEIDAALAAHTWDVILSDYRLPTLRGEDVLVTCRRAQPATPFLYVWGARGEHAAIDLLKQGATDYVLKDRLERLVPSVQRALREAHETLERKRAQEQLRNRERTLSTLMRNLPGMAFRRALERPWVLEVASEGGTALTGYAADELLGRPWASLVHPDDIEELERAKNEAYTAGTQLSATYRILTRTGEVKWIWELSACQPGEGTTASASEGFLSDITRAKEAEAEMRARIEFEQQLIGIVSHDLRNPLNTIALGANILLKREGLDTASTSTVRRVLTAAERAGRMIHDLLDFTLIRMRGELPIQPRAADLRGIASQVCEELAPVHSERVLDLRAPRPVPLVCDPDRVAQLVGNLVGNALAYSPKDTPVTVELTSDGEEALLAVHNYGTPIPADRLTELFKPLARGTNQVDRQTRSIGLGLFIAQSIVTAHHGRIDVTSSQEDGTRFVVRFPRLAPETTP